MSARLEVRLDDERKERLDMLVETAGSPTSEVVRRLIDDAWEAMMLERRKAAVERLISLNGRGRSRSGHPLASACEQIRAP